MQPQMFPDLRTPSLPNLIIIGIFSEHTPRLGACLLERSPLRPSHSKANLHVPGFFLRLN